MGLKSISTRMKTPVKILTILLAISLNHVYGTIFDEHFVSSEHFVDKSLLLKNFFEKDRRAFVTAPSGFGKTTNLKMIKKFCQMEFDEDIKIKPKLWNETKTYGLFQNLKIAQHKNIITQHLAQHPVIFLDMKLDFEGDEKLPDKNNLCRKYIDMLINAIDDYKDLIIHLNQSLAEFNPEKNNTIFNPNNYRTELKTLSMLVKGEYSDYKCDNDSEKVILRDSVFVLSKILYEYYNKSVVLLIDNYDYIIRKSSINSKGSLNLDVNELLGQNLDKISQDTFPLDVGYLMIGSVTSLGYHHFGLDKHLTGFYFYDDHNYSPHFGLTRKEVDELLGKRNYDELEKSTIKEYCNGYESKPMCQAIYNTSCTTDYFKANSIISNRETWINSQRINEPSDFIWKLLKEPEYLDQVSKLIKHSPTRHGSHEFISFANFSKLIEDDFNEAKFTSGVNSTAISFLIQQGLLGPIRGRYAFVIPNQLARLQFITDMQYYYEKVANIDLNLVGSHLLDIFISIKTNATIKPDLDEYLTKVFGKLKPLNISHSVTNPVNRTKKIKLPKAKNTTNFENFANQTNQTQVSQFQPIIIKNYTQNYVNQTEASQKFVHQSIIHLGALTNQYLKVIEDYPQPISYDRSTANVDRRCVTCITYENIALIVKNTDKTTLKVTEERAKKYYKYSQPGIEHVWYLAIHVDDRKHVSTRISKNVIIQTNGSSKSNRTRRRKKNKANLTTTLKPSAIESDDWW